MHVQQSKACADSTLRAHCVGQLYARVWVVQVIDDFLPTIASRVKASGENGGAGGMTSYVYRLRPECWPEVDVHSICIRTRKQQHDVEQQLFQHAKSNPALYTRPAAGGPSAMDGPQGGGASRRRVP